MGAVTQHLVDETKVLIEAAERGEFEQATWIAIADNLDRLQADTDWGAKRIATAVGKSDKWVRDVRGWSEKRRKGYSGTTPFSRDTRVARGESSPDDSSARKVLKERPEKVVPQIAAAMEDSEIRHKVIESMTHEAVTETSAEAGTRHHDLVEAERAKTRKPNSAGAMGVDVPAMQKELLESWIDTHLSRLDTSSNRMEHAVKENGVRLSPSSDLADVLAQAERIEKRVAEVRVVLQERLRDEKAVTA